MDPFVWRVKWSEDIVRKLARYDGIFISDAECVGVLVQQMGLESEVADLHHEKAILFCSNTHAVSWVTRMASKQSRVGGCLEKGIVFRARGRRMCLPEALNVSGDELTRWWMCHQDHPMSQVGICFLILNCFLTLKRIFHYRRIDPGKL